MKLTLTRRWETDKSVIGMIDVDGLIQCFSLERPRAGDHPCVPEGTYEVAMSWSEHFQKQMPHLLNVPGRSAIMIHPANWPSELLGCIAPGSSRGPDAVYSSQNAFNLLLGKMQAAWTTGDIVTIDIVKVGNGPNLAVQATAA